MRMARPTCWQSPGISSLLRTAGAVDRVRCGAPSNSPRSTAARRGRVALSWIFPAWLGGFVSEIWPRRMAWADSEKVLWSPQDVLSQQCRIVGRARRHRNVASDLAGRDRTNVLRTSTWLAVSKPSEQAADDVTPDASGGVLNAPADIDGGPDKQPIVEGGIPICHVSRPRSASSTRARSASSAGESEMDEADASDGRTIRPSLSRCRSSRAAFCARPRLSRMLLLVSREGI